ncbi:amidase domain-containing protein [Clostridium pasteurianum]|uniref:amidase domain-containing protein n=1 Tax=Clostridium pasteurianum TaxID=1501 RepID=UPI0008DBBD49|nr:amidase domain-containing protein [Clostridium pasteurianum]AOZ78023.1 hypothetical protein AQ984_03530 [Clostridium pasteurianum]
MNNFEKTIKKLGLVVISFLLIFSPISKAHAEENINDVNEIKGIVSKYFNDEFESIKKGQAISQDDTISNNKLKEFIDLKYSREALWFKKINNQLTKYSINIDYNSIDFNENSCIINISKYTEFSFSNIPDTVSKEWGNHVLTLKKINNKWFIDEDIDKSDTNTDDISNKKTLTNNDNSDTIIDKKIASLKTSNIDTDINEYKQFIKKIKESKEKNNLIKSSNLITPMGSFGGHKWQVDYNRTAAVNYAHKWANSYNPEYWQYSNDCTNFVSQCIFAGAPQTNPLWYGSYIMSSNAWVNVKGLWNFLINNTSEGPVAMDNTHYLDMDYGDPIEFWSYYEKDYSHAVIVTKIDWEGDGVCYSGHTSPRLDYPLSMAYASESYDPSKTRTAHIFGYNTIWK